MRNNIVPVPNKPMKPDGKTVFEIDDGTKEITLLNKYGRVICTFHFRAGELDIKERFETLQERLPKILEPLTRVDLNPDGTAVDMDEGWAVLTSVEGALKKQLNELLDMDEADEIFKKHNPFSSVGGVFFISKVLDAIGDVVEATVKEETEKQQARIKEYIEDLREKFDAGKTTDNT